MKRFDNLYKLILEQTDEKVLKNKDFTVTFQSEAKKSKKPETFSISLVKDMQDKYAFKINYRHYEFYSYITKTKEDEIVKLFDEVTENEDTVIDYFLSDNIAVYLDLIESANFIAMLKERQQDKDIFNKAEENKEKTEEQAQEAEDEKPPEGLEEPKPSEDELEDLEPQQNVKTLAQISKETEE